jgi:hypothetical protein
MYRPYECVSHFSYGRQAVCTIVRYGKSHLTTYQKDRVKVNNIRPDGENVTVNLKATPGFLTTEWFEPSTGESVKGLLVRGGKWRSFSSPFRGDAVLYLRSSHN